MSRDVSRGARGLASQCSFVEGLSRVRKVLRTNIVICLDQVKDRGLQKYRENGGQQVWAGSFS